MREALLRTKALSIGYSGPRKRPTVIARDLGLSLYPGEIATLIGPNGVGKSTLLRTVAGLQMPLRGEVLVDEKSISSFTPRELARSVSVVLTERINVGLLTAFTLVSLGRYPYTDWSGKLSGKDSEIIHWAIGAVDAENLAQRYVEQLSDGERQKVMIARALAQETRIIILDEPTAFLDIPRRMEIVGLLRKLTRDANKSILFSTHDLELALKSSDRIFLMAQGGGLTVGAPEDLVLSGAIESSFQSEDLVFDRALGTFVVTQYYKGRVSVVGEGMTALWTQRALEREGFKISDSMEERIRVEVIDGAWNLMVEGEASTHTSIYELTDHLRELGEVQ
jgi:iron complex transport system ATP-binding protein